MGQDRQDYYELLGIKPGATTKDIKRAYRKMAHRFHPDHNPGNDDAARQFRDVTKAYTVLAREDSRADYDFRHSASQHHSPGYHRATDPVMTKRPDKTLFEKLHEGELDTGLHAFALCTVLAYAVMLVCDTSLQVLAFLGIFATLMGFAFTLMRDEFMDFFEAPIALPYNICWLLVLMLVFNSAYYDRFESVFGLQFSIGYRTEGFFPGIFRFGIYLYWLALYSEWRWLVCLWGLGIIAASLERTSPLGGWMLFGAQLILATVTRYNPDLISFFAVYYQPLFTIQPLTPSL